MNPEDGTRLEEFRQFRREVRGSGEYLLVGCVFHVHPAGHSKVIWPPIPRSSGH